MAIKLTKNELKKQKDNLKQFQRYLPTLQLKKQQLQTVIMGIRAELERKEAERIQMIGDLDDWVAVFAENELFEEKKRLDRIIASRMEKETILASDLANLLEEDRFYFYYVVCLVCLFGLLIWVC